ncbi:hypothetical protein ACT4MK_46275 [Bradyrhizobium barranii]|uniref:hypothetical protein n=1 Tax=Bradyrhizobium TaxID=374 RepID=UPI003F24040F
MSSARMVRDAPKAALLTMTVDDLSASQRPAPSSEPALHTGHELDILAWGGPSGAVWPLIL